MVPLISLMDFVMLQVGCCYVGFILNHSFSVQYYLWFSFTRNQLVFREFNEILYTIVLN